MADPNIACIVSQAAASLPVHIARPEDLAALLVTLPAASAAMLRSLDFAAKSGELVFLQGTDGLAGAVFGIGADRSAHVFGDLPYRLPGQTAWHLVPGNYDAANAVLGYALGAYRYTAFKTPARAPATLVAPAGAEWSLIEATSAWMVRDLINTPANLLGPAELAIAAVELAQRFGAVAQTFRGEILEKEYPTIAAVGAGSARAAEVVVFRWSGSAAPVDAPLVSLCGKGVCFDTGGYDLKPSAGMLRMKKDMGGAAIMLGLARLLMQADLPIRLVVRIGCIENSVSGSAMRPSDVFRTRRGLTVEIGNTDAEGRLVLCDLLAEASDEAPAILIDAATLTGAARVALGPDLPALFSNDDSWADAVTISGRECHDPVWRLPLWSGYDSWLSSSVADLNNVASKPFAGAVVAALFLQRFVTTGVSWIHLDTYAWNDQTRPGRPEGGEAQAMFAVFGAIQRQFS